MDRELIEKVKRHDISFHEIDKILDANASVELRRTAISQLTGTQFDHIYQDSPVHFKYHKKEM